MKLILRSLSLVICLLFFRCDNPTKGLVISKDNETAIWIDPTLPKYVEIATDDLIADIQTITGVTLKKINKISDCTGNNNCIVISSVENEVVKEELGASLAESLMGQWESYTYFTIDNDNEQGNKLVILGADDRGAMFGIYHFLEKELGVDPLKLWTDYEPKKQEKIILKNINYMDNGPDVKFRGWFINDEDLLTEWKNGGGKRNIDYPFYGQVVSPKVMEKVIETAVRLRYNTIIPASFMDIRNPDEELLLKEAAKRGLYISMHHIEPLGVSAFGYENYWKEQGKKPLFSFYSERDKLEQTWRHYAKMWAKYPNVIWQVGLRGIGDRPMWLADPGIPQSDKERGKLISDAMKLQKQIIQEVTGNKDPIMTTTLWAEGSYFKQKGFLDIPEDVIVVFADNSAGWVWQPDFYETKREPNQKYGVYYHHQLWGSGPHLVQAIPPSKTYEMFKKVMEHGSNEYLIMNVSNIREFVLGIEASTKMLWDFSAFDVDTFLKDWCGERFPEEPQKTYEAYQQFFNAYHLSGEKQLPVFLDGLQRGKGLNVLKQIEELIKEEGEKSGDWEKIKKDDPFKVSLSDMHPDAKGNLDEQIEQVRKQLNDVKKSLQLAQKANKELAGESKIFFETNLIAQAKILYGIGGWLESCLKAKKTMIDGNLEETKTLLNEALLALKNVDEGKQLASHGKWVKWYRGDRKMNMDMVKERTKIVNDLVAPKH